MMRGGQRPTPAAVQIAQGDPRKLGVHKLQEKLEREPKATRGLPKCPKHLAGRAKAAWKLWAEELEVMGLDRRPDAMMLEGACVGYARAVQADLVLEKEGITCTESTITESGVVVILKVRKHPAVDIANSSWSQVRAFCSEFGLSPVSRTRLSVEKKDDSISSLAEILARPREKRPGIQ